MTAPMTRERMDFPCCEHCGKEVHPDEYDEALEYCIECALLLGFQIAASPFAPKEPTDS